MYSSRRRPPCSTTILRNLSRTSSATSTIWAKLEKAATFDTDPTFVKKDAVAWLLLDVVNHQDGPNGGATLSKTQFVQRVNTTGGLAPSTGCASPADAGNDAFVHYTADYVFYRAVDSED
jgi:hypothetical protein